jgi:hypothetical protein
MKRVSILIIALLSINSASNAEADFIADLGVNVTSISGGGFHYEYTLSNESISTLNAESLSVLVSGDAVIYNIESPSGWGSDYSSSSIILTWETNDFSFNLLPGSAVSFAFDSNFGPTSQTFLIAGFDDTGQNFDTNTGLTSSPGVQTVPEPTSMILLGTGMLTLAGYKGYRNRTTR